MIKQMAFAIADSQIALDRASMEVAEMMSGRRLARDDEGHVLDTEGEVIPIDQHGRLDPATNQELDYIPSTVFFGRYQDESGEWQPHQLSMLELGFTPNFYQFIDTVIEVKMSIKMTRETSYERKHQGTITKKTTEKKSVWFFSQSKETVVSTPVDATFSSKYSYSAEGSSLLRTKLVPVPPPPILEERIRAQLDREMEAEKLAAEAE